MRHNGGTARCLRTEDKLETLGDEPKTLVDDEVETLKSKISQTPAVPRIYAQGTGAGRGPAEKGSEKGIEEAEREHGEGGVDEAGGCERGMPRRRGLR